MISNKIVFCKIEYNDKSYDAKLFYQNNSLYDIELDPYDNPSIVGDIFIGKVTKISNELDAAFVKISDETEVFLPLKNAKNPIYANKLSRKSTITQGDEIVLEIVKDSIKKKQAVATCNVSFSNDLAAIVSSEDMSIGVSNKIAKDRGANLKNMISDYLNNESEYIGNIVSQIRAFTNFTIILRTNCDNICDDEIISSVNELLFSFNAFLNNIVHKNCFYHEKTSNDYVNYVNRFSGNDIEKIVCESPEVYKYLSKRFESGPFNKYLDILEQYSDSYSLQKLLGINSVLDTLMSNKVWMKSGAFLYIEQTETLTLIDVNSGKSSSNKDKRNNMLSVNLDAVSYIADQIRLRNISGMIIIDFINMSFEDSQIIFDAMKSAVKDDSCYVKVIDFTKLGLLEMTREKKYKSLREKVLT